MDQNQNTTLFGLNVDQIGKGHLAEAARWGKFLAVVGFVICALVAVGGIFFGSMFANMNERYSDFGGSDNVDMGGMGIMFTVMYILIAVIYFFPCLFLFRFATKMKVALASNDQNTLNASFQNLKAMFRFVGILTLIVLILYALALIGILATQGMSS